MIQLDFEAGNNEEYKIKGIWDSMVFAKKSEVGHFLIGDLLFWYNHKEHLGAYISNLTLWELLAPRRNLFLYL